MSVVDGKLRVVGLNELVRALHDGALWVGEVALRRVNGLALGRGQGGLSCQLPLERLAGPVSDQIDAGIAFLARFMQSLPAKGPSTGTVPVYDLDVVDEAIVNAVAHRDYAIAGSKIRLFLFADRLELYSPGRLPSTITLDAMLYRTFTRNQLLVSFLSRLRSKRTGQVFLESRGEGVRKILED